MRPAITGTLIIGFTLSFLSYILFNGATMDIRSDIRETCNTSVKDVMQFGLVDSDPVSDYWGNAIVKDIKDGERVYWITARSAGWDGEYFTTDDIVATTKVKK